jgi:hypothetical protein
MPMAQIRYIVHIKGHISRGSNQEQKRRRRRQQERRDIRPPRRLGARNSQRSQQCVLFTQLACSQS